MYHRHDLRVRDLSSRNIDGEWVRYVSDDDLRAMTSELLQILLTRTCPNCCGSGHMCDCKDGWVVAEGAEIIQIEGEPGDFTWIDTRSDLPPGPAIVVPLSMLPPKNLK